MSTVTAKFKRDNHIAQRRELEYKDAVNMHSIKGHNNVSLKAKWEAKTDAIITKRIIRDRVQDMKKRAATNLNIRKEKLAAILAAEDKQYELEFMNNLETPT